MGLVTCEKCGKIYDYDKHNGLCPKCARYNRENTAAQEHQEYHDKYDGGYSHTTKDDHHSYHQRYDSDKNPHGSQLEAKRAKTGTMDKKTKIILGVVFGLLFISIVPFFGPFLFIVAIWALVVVKGKKKK